RGQVDPVGVDVLHRVLEPGLPGLSGDLVEDALTQRILVRGAIETGEVLAELLAMHGARHDVRFLTRMRPAAPALAGPLGRARKAGQAGRRGASRPGRSEL